MMRRCVLGGSVSLGLLGLALTLSSTSSYAAPAKTAEYDLRVSLVHIDRSNTEVLLDTAAPPASVQNTRYELRQGKLWVGGKALAMLANLRRGAVLGVNDTPPLVEPDTSHWTNAKPKKGNGLGKLYRAALAANGKHPHHARRTWQQLLKRYQRLGATARRRYSHQATAASLGLCDHAYRKLLRLGLSQVTPELLRKQRRQFASLQSKLRKIHRLGSARWRHIVHYRQGRLWERLWILGRLASYHPWPNNKALALGSQTAKALRQARSAYQAVVKSAPQRSPSPYNLLAETRLRALKKPTPLVYIRDLQRRVRHKGANRILLRHGPTVLRPLLAKKLRRTLVVWLDCPPSAAQLQLERWLLRRQRRAHGAIPVVRLLTEKACIGKPRPNPHGSARIAREAGLLSSHVFLVKGDGSLAAFLGAWLNTKRKRLALVKALKLLLPIPRGPSPEQLRLQRQGRRALTLAKTQARKGSIGMALRHVERAVSFLPTDSQDDARRLRALLKARHGDLSGALKDVAWWRQRYGEVSAEELMDELRKARGGPGR